MAPFRLLQMWRGRCARGAIKLALKRTLRDFTTILKNLKVAYTNVAVIVIARIGNEGIWSTYKKTLRLVAYDVAKIFSRRTKQVLDI